MVSDIAAAYGRHATLGREQMMWCLFRHTAAQAFRDLVVRMGDRLVFRRMSWGVAERVAKQIGIKLTQRTLSKGVSRWLPVIGALGVGAYAYYDTGQVAGTAIEMFEGEHHRRGRGRGRETKAKTPCGRFAGRQGGEQRRAQGRQHGTQGRQSETAQAERRIARAADDAIAALRQAACWRTTGAAACHHAMIDPSRWSPAPAAASAR